jgi:hypothetical protein
MMTKMAMRGILESLSLRRNIRKIQPAVNPKVSTLKVEKVSLIISRGLVKGV